MLTIGTVCGVFQAKTANAKFNQYFLQAINDTNLEKEDVVFDLKKYI